MGEVSYLKLKLADMEGKQGHGGERQHKAEVWLLTKLKQENSYHQIFTLQLNVLFKVSNVKLCRFLLDNIYPKAKSSHIKHDQKLIHLFNLIGRLSIISPCKWWGQE